jgi:hypothetical protein
MAVDLERHDFSPNPSRLTREPKPILYRDVILDGQLHLRVFKLTQGLNVRITAEDETGKQHGTLKAKTKDVCNGAHPLLETIECSDEKPEVGLLLLLSLREIATERGGVVSYEAVEEPTKQWMTNNGIGNLLEAPTNPNI